MYFLQLKVLFLYMVEKLQQFLNTLKLPLTAISSLNPEYIPSPTPTPISPKYTQGLIGSHHSRTDSILIIISATNTNRSDQKLLLVGIRLQMAGTQPYIEVLLVPDRPMTVLFFHVRLPPGFFGDTVLLVILWPIIDVDPLLSNFLQAVLILAYMRQLVEINLGVTASDTAEVNFVEGLVKFGIGLQIFELDILQRLQYSLVMTHIVNFGSNILNLLLMAALDDAPQRVVLVLKGSVHGFEFPRQILLQFGEILIENHFVVVEVVYHIGQVILLGSHILLRPIVQVLQFRLRLPQRQQLVP